MESLVIHVASRESGEGFRGALKEFDAKLVESEDGRYHVEIPLGAVGTKQIVASLNAIEAYVTQRGDGPAHLELGGHPYLLEPADE